MARSALFANSDIAATINQHFEPVWQKVREVPRAEIDFGNGRKLTRTLSGNVATWFVTADGGVYDLAPGVMSPTEYARRLKQAQEMHKQLLAAPTADRSKIVAAYHREMTVLQPKGSTAVAAEGRRLGPMPDMRKFIVEGPIKKALGTRAIERRVGYMLMAAGTPTKPTPAGPKPAHALDGETTYNNTHRVPKVHAMLAANPLATPASLTKPVFKTILDVDLDDPYLGLAPYVLGGEPGRG